MSFNFTSKNYFMIFLISIVLLHLTNISVAASLKNASSSFDFKLSKKSFGDTQRSDNRNGQITSENVPWQHFRLPRNVVPVHYNIVFSPQIEGDTFNGEVNITVNVTKATFFLIVHSKGLNISKSEVYDTERKNFLDIEGSFHEGLDYFVIETIDEIKIGKYILNFIFSGVYEHGIGIYREEYEFAENDKRSLVMTFFAPIYARRAFPCFDEPSLKSTFTVEVVHNSTYSAISNMPIKSEVEIGNGTKVTKFETTPPMSTYLLCIVICDFEYKETTTENGITIRGYASKRTIEKIETALNWTSNILTFYESYLNVPYPLRKLDFVSLPEFDANGMENWGLITYKEQSLLFDNTSSVTHKLEVAKLVAHELAHMWFGNLVTMNWWNETWLNEGFATHFAWKGAKHVLPEYFMVDDSGLSEFLQIIEQDQTIHARPVIKAVTEVIYSDVYNGIVYKKGATLLRMLEKFINESNLLKGITNYLKKHAYRNVKTEYLWREINEFTKNQGIDVSTLMNSWLTKNNFPYIDIRCQAKNNCSCEIFQNRFLLDPSPKQLNQQYSWNVPLSYRTLDSTSVKYIIFNSEHKYNLCNQSNILKFNSLYTGYYAVKYTEKKWIDFNRILEENHTVLHETDRLNLLSDAFTLASDNKISYSIPLNLTLYLKKEEYHSIWSQYLKFMNAIKGYLSEDKTSTTALKRYTKRLGKQLYRKYLWKNDGDFYKKKLRRELIDAMCGNNARSCVEVAVEAFKKWKNGEMPNPEVSELVYKYGLKAMNDETSYNHMWNQYLNEINPLLKKQYRDALSNVRKPSLLKRLLKDSMEQKYFKISWQIPMIKSIAENDRGFPIVADYIFKNWNDVVRKFGCEQAENIAETVFSKYQTTKDLLKVKEFYKKHLDSTNSSDSRSRTLDNIQLRINWKNKFQAQVAEWFQINSKL